MPAYTYENFVTMNFLINFLVLKLNLCLKKKIRTHRLTNGFNFMK